MQAIERYNEFKDTDLDVILIKIRKGEIKSGRYAHLVKIDKNKTYDDNKHNFFESKKGG